MSIDKKPRTKILVDINSIFDFRQSKLAMLGGVEETQNYLVSEDYNFREIDDFSSIINMEKYNNYYELNDLLMYTTVTYVMALIKLKIDSLENLNALKSVSTVGEVIVNTYPYTLPDKLKDILQNAIFIKLGKVCFVEMICLPPKDITPYYILASEISYIYMYDYSDWLNANSDAMDKTPLRNIVIYLPALYKLRPGPDDIKLISSTGFKDFFSYMEYLYSLRTVIRFLPVIMYSNEVIASLYLEKLNSVVKESNRKDIEEFKKKGGLDGDLSSKIQVL